MEELGEPAIRTAPALGSISVLTDLAEGLDFLSIFDLLRSPVDGTKLTYDISARRIYDDGHRHAFAVQSGIPCLFAPNRWPEGTADVTDIVKEFYEKTPFPNYDGLDNRESLRRKARESHFARIVDEQIPQSAKILEIGCGTGQMTNFLGMGWNRTVIGADLCMNSLQLGKGFRDRFSINNAHFVQINLFRPPFPTGQFDLVISNGVLHHTSDCAAAFKSIASLVKPGGFIVIGLYNWLGRLPTLWQRSLIDRFGNTGTWFDHRLRGKGEMPRRTAWFMDQYKHPHETKHSIDEVLVWFDAAGFDFTSCIPTIGDHEFSDDLRLFELNAPGRYLDRLSTELEMLVSGGADGGLSIMIGKRRA
jgi:SAM-dependent methyltransferase